MKYVGKAELCFAEDGKCIDVFVQGRSVEEVKMKMGPSLVKKIAEDNNMQPGEVVMDCTIENSEGNFIDHDEYFIEYSNGDVIVA